MDSTVLLVIDEQIGAFDGKVIPAVYQADQLLERSEKLVAAARAAGVPVIFVQHCAPEGQLLVEGTEAWEIHPALTPTADEDVVLKRESSAFDGTELERLCKEAGVTTVITCGLQSDHCVSNTSIGALDLGLGVFVAGDAHSTWATDEEPARTIIRRCNQELADRGAQVEQTNALIQLMRG